MGISRNRALDNWEARALPLSYTRISAEFVPKKTSGIIPEALGFVLLQQFVDYSIVPWRPMHNHREVVYIGEAYAQVKQNIMITRA